MERHMKVRDLNGHLVNWQISPSTCFTWVKVFKIIPEFRILRLTFHGKTASKC